MGHVESISITRTIDGKHYNIPTVIDGEPRSDKEAVRIMTDRGLGRPFPTLPEATRSAKLKSSMISPRIGVGTGRSPKGRARLTRGPVSPESEGHFNMDDTRVTRGKAGKTAEEFKRKR